MKKSLLHYLVYGNKAAVICVVFTISTMVDLMLSAMYGQAEISYWHLGTRFVLCVLIILSFSIFKHFERLPLYAIIFLHSIAAIVIMLCDVWIESFFMEIHPNAYRDAVRTMLIIYPIIIVGSIIIDSLRTAKANRILKKHLVKM